MVPTEFIYQEQTKDYISQTETIVPGIVTPMQFSKATEQRTGKATTEQATPFPME